MSTLGNRLAFRLGYRSILPAPTGSIEISELYQVLSLIDFDSTDTTDLVGMALDLLIEQFQRKPNITRTLQSFAEEILEPEGVFSKLRRGLDYSLQSGESLDFIGAIVGEDRQGRTDEEYRQAIEFRIYITNSDGTPDPFISAFQYFTQSENIRYKEVYPGRVQIYGDGSTVPAGIYLNLKSILPAGVALNVIMAPNITTPFAFALNSTGIGITGTGGFSSESWIDPGTGLRPGGRFATLITENTFF